VSATRPHDLDQAPFLAEGEPGEVLDPARHGGDSAGVRVLLDGSQVRIRVAPKAIKRLKSQLRVLTGRSWRAPMESRIGKLNRFITAWVAYFRLADTEPVFRSLDGWLRRRLRQFRWKE
jgi:Group II intron, maturase-specific domain